MPDRDSQSIFPCEILPLFEAARGDWISRARDAARRLAQAQGEITINDVRALCPPPEGADPRIMGSVFLKRDFERVGFKPSTRDACHGRMIGVFRLRAGASARAGATIGEA
jgi:hypothetical protein